MSGLYFLGLDPSSTSPGYCVLDDDGDACEFGTFEALGKKHTWHRSQNFAAQLHDVLTTWEPIAHAAIEGVAFRSPKAAVLTEIGTVFRMVMDTSDVAVPWSVVNPQSLKKYVGAKGKDEVRLAVFKEWGFEHRSNDVVDAFVLAQIAKALYTTPKNLTAPRSEVLGTIRTRERTDKRSAGTTA